MALPKQIELSDYIKLVHRNLREYSKRVGAEKAWEEHCTDEEQLEKYSQAMQELAKTYWEKNCKQVNRISRVEWTHAICTNYFRNGLLKKWRDKELEIAKQQNFKYFNTTECCTKQEETKIKLLDVGSCYNPFASFMEYDTLAIDLAPANGEVLKCDFLKVNLSCNNVFEDSQVICIKEDQFDVVVFSLLLEYLPTSEQRLKCCKKAYNVLKTEGLLIIITPDSKHVGANSKIIKSWRFILANLGFSRILYEKLPHTHCMAFRKSISPLITQRWVDIYKQEGLYSEMFIPQDLQEKNEIIPKCRNISVENDPITYFHELPNCDTYD